MQNLLQRDRDTDEGIELTSFGPVTITPLIPSLEIAGAQGPSTNNTTDGAIRLMSLPPEIRLKIITFVVVSSFSIFWQGQCTINDTSTKAHRTHQLYCNISTTTSGLPEQYTISSLLLTSRILYTEAAPVFYRNNTFQFSSLASGIPIVFENDKFAINLRHLVVSCPEQMLRSRGLRRLHHRKLQTVHRTKVEWINRRCPNIMTLVNNIPLPDPTLQIQAQAQAQPPAPAPPQPLTAAQVRNNRRTNICLAIFFLALIGTTITVWIIGFTRSSHRGNAEDSKFGEIERGKH